MKPATLLLALGLILATAGCAQFGTQEAALSKSIAPSEVDWARANGTNSVSGVALINARGTPHTCAGPSANLIPDNAYATKGMRAASVGAVKFERDDPLYVSSLRTTRCDASGSFSFARVPDGVWYVTSSVKWQGASQVEGGSMMQRVDLRGGRLVKVSLP
jgi:hypothetical protein